MMPTMSEQQGQSDFFLKKTLKAMDERISQLRNDFMEAIAKDHIDSAPSAPVIVVKDELLRRSGSSASAAFSLRYRNDTIMDNEEQIHRLEYIAKSSPWQANEDGTPYEPTGDYATDYAHFWPDDQWTAVPGADFVE